LQGFVKLGISIIGFIMAGYVQLATRPQARSLR